MHAQIGGATGASAHGTTPRPARVKVQAKNEAVSVTMSHALRGARGGITRRMGRQRQRHMHQRDISTSSLLVLDSPHVSSIHPDAENAGNRRRIAQLGDAHMPIWTRNFVWIPDQDHSSAVMKNVGLHI